jgi:hypothetical protein
MKKLISLEPVLSASTVQALLALIIAVGVHLSPAVTGGIEAVAAALLALITAASVDKVTPALWTGLVTALGTLLIAFGVPHVNAGEVSAVNAVLAIVLASLLREKVSPRARTARSPRRDSSQQRSRPAARWRAGQARS